MQRDRGIIVPVGFDACYWPLSRLDEGIEVLARRARLIATSAPAILHRADDFQTLTGAIARRIEWSGKRLGIEAEAVESAVSSIERLIDGAGPALFHFAAPSGACFLLLLKCRRGSIHLVGPDLQLHRHPAESLRAALCGMVEAPLVMEIDRLLAAADVAPARRQRVRAAMLHERLAGKMIGNCWILRMAPSTGIWRQVVQARLPQRVAAMLCLFALMYLLEIAGWGLIGKAVLNGNLDHGWLLAWVMMLVSLIPLRMAGGWLDATFALDAATLLKSRLLVGALRSDLESVKSQGAGQLLGRVMESQALESLAINGGLAAMVAVIELVLAAAILASGAGGLMHLALLCTWLAIAVWLSLRFIGRMQRWTGARLDMTHSLVERMLGHRTCLAQQWPASRDARDDQEVRHYLDRSRAMDQATTPVSAGIPAGWMVIGLLGLVPAFVSGEATPSGLAIGLGGVLLASRGLSGIASGLAGLARAGLAWRNVAPLFRAAGEPDATGPYLDPGRLAAADDRPGSGKGGATAPPLVDAAGLVFRYEAQRDPVLRGLDLSIRHGERILLEGPSGGGKSTLAALLVGLRQPQAGLLLLNGLDRHTLGESWHQLATEAPQFHENHILAGTIGFNLLMGRNWPATTEELEEARLLCVELGLGELLDRMPSGMMQMIGETGWQLSHGEQSRIFLARALLQDAQLTILDESFAALDPETLKLCIACAFRRARTLIVVAHP